MIKRRQAAVFVAFGRALLVIASNGTSSRSSVTSGVYLYERRVDAFFAIVSHRRVVVYATRKQDDK